LASAPQGADVILVARDVERLQQAAEDVAALAVHLMGNTAMTGAVYDIDGGQQLIP
jgi:hypothetical protein